MAVKLGTAGNDSLVGTLMNDEMYGLAGDNSLAGDAGDDFFVGGEGADQMFGGAGIDTASYETALSQVVAYLHNTPGVLGDAAGDRLFGIENLIGSAFDDELGGDGNNNIIRGLGGNDDLRSGLGTDTLIGGTGNDTYHITNEINASDGFDTVIEAANQGIDTIDCVGGESYTLPANVENLDLGGTDIGNGNALHNVIYGNHGVANTLNGLGGNDTLIGDKDTTAGLGDRLNGGIGNDVLQGRVGNDILDGGSGTDTMAGGSGNDVYYVDNIDDVVTEAGVGTDTVYTTVNLTLAPSVEVGRMLGSSNLSLTGNGGGQSRLYGNTGNNILDTGGGGANLLSGGGGNDTYLILSASDLIVEGANQGTDTVITSASYGLRAGVHVETLQSSNAAGTFAINLAGNEFANTINGNNGNNALTGGRGADIMRGLLGNDTYVVDNALDRALEAANQGTDTVSTSVSYTLAAGFSLERLQTTNGLATISIHLSGNELANSVFGNNGANIINGRGGRDILTGGGGKDVFAFDTALSATTNVDTITDFSVVDDYVRLENSVFTALATGLLAAGAFRIGAAAVDADDRIIYNAATGALIYDSNGVAANGAVQFATLAKNLLLTHADFAVI